MFQNVKKKKINIRYFFNNVHKNVNSYKFKIYFFNFNFYCYVIYKLVLIFCNFVNLKLS